jgi:HK97 family phage major capsid protein
MVLDVQSQKEVGKDAGKIKTRDELYAFLGDIIKNEISASVAASVVEAKEKGDKLLQDNGSDGIFKMLMDRENPARKERVSAAAKHIGGVMHVLCKSQCNKLDAIERAKASGNDDVIKTIQQTNFSGGGAILEPGFYNEIVEYLRAETLVRKMGATSIPLVNGRMTVPFLSSGSTASYTTEGTAVNATTVEMGNLLLSGKKIMAIVPISNDWLRSEGAQMFGGAQLVTDDMVLSLSNTEDAAFIRGSGSAGYPKGLRYWAISDNVNAQSKAGATVTVAEAGYDLTRLMYYPKVQNVKIRKGGYIFSPRTWLALATARDGNNNLIWAPEMAAGTLLGQQWGETTNVPDNLSSSYSEIIFASFGSIVIGEETNITVDLLKDSTYLDSTGTMQSGVSKDESVARVIASHDFGARHRGKEIAVITGVDWTKLA